MKQSYLSLQRVTAIAMLAAMSYVVFTFLQIKISLPGGAIGMTIGDLFDPVYVIYAPKTFLLKLCIGLITGFVAHKLGRISESNDPRHILRWSALAAAAGLLFNVIFDPLVGYFYKLVILGKPAAEVTLAWNVASTSINAVISAVAAVAIYAALRPALRRAGLAQKLEPHRA